MHKPASAEPRKPAGPRAETSVQSLGTTWFQSDLGDELDVEQLSQLSELDPTGSKGVVNEVLVMLLESLDPMLLRLERFRATGNIEGMRFEAHKLQSASAQLGALRLSTACKTISAYVSDKQLAALRPDDVRLNELVDLMNFESVRLERRLHKLLNG